MRTAVCRAIVFLTVTATAHGASMKASTLVRDYNDGATRVTSPHLDVSSTFLAEQASVGAGYAMDFVTSASSDVRSFASRSEIADIRREVSANLGWLVTGGSLGWGYVQSDENDYHSKSYSVSAMREFFEKNTVINLGFVYGDDHIGSSKDKTLNEPMTNHTFSVGVTQVYSKVSVAQLLYDARIENGYLISPYRNARVLQADGSVIGVPENHPRTRNRNAIAFKYNYFIQSLQVSLASSFRFYVDSWDVKSGTIEERIGREWGRKFSTAINLRYYQQTAANFYQDKYSGALGPFYTGNKTLASYSTVLFGFRPTYKVSDQFSLYAKGEYYIETFQNHTDVGNISVASDDRLLILRATVVGLGIDATF